MPGPFSDIAALLGFLAGGLAVALVLWAFGVPALIAFPVSIITALALWWPAMSTGG